jgi:hypothetical protein
MKIYFNFFHISVYFQQLVWFKNYTSLHNADNLSGRAFPASFQSSHHTARAHFYSGNFMYVICKYLRRLCGGESLERGSRNPARKTIRYSFNSRLIQKTRRDLKDAAFDCKKILHAKAKSLNNL